ncbi:ABC transporter ATP-binding protein [Cohnella sp. AR92]|uniref:ABC transporter ATP-binding protein n=1 Tax=Cohnella sp. AR92 TaxID=648716 RepID=UPI000F8C8642|nr:ABC transporter ATP-binding protein [Cohnella sp. AR92]RUS48620.1 ABC transporter ATP-binding protein [Cohnella sp. AR92]
MKDKLSIEILELIKHYGRKKALSEITLTIGQGMFGLLGPNGAGKTTLMRTLATLLPKSGGRLNVCGIPIENASEVRGLIGYLPQDFSMYPRMSVYAAMDYLGALSGLDRSARKERIPRLLERVNLDRHHRTKVKALSGGMRRRLGIAQAILHDPKVLIVDEPTAGLDPEERIRFRHLLAELAEERIVILSTHIVGDIEAACENIAVLESGRLLYQGTTAQLTASAEGKVYIAEVDRQELDSLKKKHTVTGMLASGNRVQVRLVADAPPIAGAVPCVPNMEDAYMLLMREKGASVHLPGEVR